MPRLDGMEVARAVGKSNFNPAVIFVTAFEGFAVDAFDLAAMDYLLKPVSFERLVRAIDRVLALTRTDVDRKSVVEGKSVSGSVDLGGGSRIKTTKNQRTY